MSPPSAFICGSQYANTLKHIWPGTYWGDESVVDALKKLIPFLFRLFCNRLIFKLKKLGGTKTGSQLATLFVTFSSAQVLT